MKYTMILYIAICVMFFTVLTNWTLLDSSWNGIAMWLCTGVFIFATTIYLSSKRNTNEK